MTVRLGVALILMVLVSGLRSAADSDSIPTPAGLYAMTSYTDNPAADGSTALPIDLATNQTFLSDDVAGVAIYVPLSALLPDPLPAQYTGMSWSQLFDAKARSFNDWNWAYLDSMVTFALQHKKLYSLAFVIGYQNSGTPKLGPQPADAYLQDYIQAKFPNTPRPYKVPSFEQSLPSWFEPLCNPSNKATYYPLPRAAGGSPPSGASLKRA